MSVGRLTESTVEDPALDWLSGLGYTILHGPDIAFYDTLGGQRQRGQGPGRRHPQDHRP